MVKLKFQKLRELMSKKKHYLAVLNVDSKNKINGLASHKMLPDYNEVSIKR